MKGRNERYRLGYMNSLRVFAFQSIIFLRDLDFWSSHRLKGGFNGTNVVP